MRHVLVVTGIGLLLCAGLLPLSKPAAFANVAATDDGVTATLATPSFTLVPEVSFIQTEVTGEAVMVASATPQPVHTSSPTYVDEKVTDAAVFTPIAVQAADMLATAVPDYYEPDNTSAESRTIVSGVPQNHSIAPVGDRDWVRFNVVAASAVTLATSGSENSDTVLYLYNSSMNLIHSDDDSNTGWYSVIGYNCADPLPAGVYYAFVEDYSNDNMIADYQLSLALTICPKLYLPVLLRMPTPTPTPPTLVPENEGLGNDSRAQADANPASWALRYPPTEFSGRTDDTSDYYRVVATAAGRLEVTLYPTSQGLNTGLQLVLRTAVVGSPVLDYKHSSPFTISYNLPAAGTYYIQVTVTTPDNAPYTLRFTAIP